MRRSNGFFLLLVVAFAACGDDGTGAADTDTDATGSSSSGEAPPADDSTTAAADDTTGPMAETMLDPCDPLAAAPCDEGVCAGAPQAGFYCRPACSSMAEVGDDCGAEGVCLPVGYGEGLACVDLTTCDLTSADGCDLAAGESCVAVSLEPLRTACVPSGTTGAGMSCAPGGMHACDVGLACLGSDLEGGDPGLCTPLCLPEDPLPPGCALCIPLNDEIGTCSECSVLDDQCPAGSQCQPVNELLGGVCVPHGPGGPGDPCTIGGADGCQADHLCLETDVDDVFACTPVCDPAAPMCPGELSCVDLGAFLPGAPSGQLGVCIDTPVVYCDPDARPTGCPASEECLTVGEGLGVCGAACDPTEGQAACGANEACVPATDGAIFLDAFVEGNGACGTGCMNDGECGGGTCLLLAGLDVAGLCGTTCTPGVGAECAASETCVATSGDPGVGACVPGGMACDPAMVGQCAASGGSCLAIEGSATGTCVPGCYVQDPGACGGVPTDCRVRTDPAWHGGVCLGGGEPCDLVAQNCAKDQTCDVTGGGPIGGNAILCDAAGATPEGGDCSGDADVCGPGLACFADACRAYCDPAGDDCVAGTCTDISAAFYLAAGTVGVCV
jgi:hypothetical protein